HRGEARTLTVTLEVTGQRVAAYTLLGLGAAGLATSGALVGAALYEQSQAQSLDARRMSQGRLTTADLARYESLVSTRNDLRTAAGVALGGAVAVGGTGVFLAIFDQPAARPNAHRDAPSKPTPTPERSLDVSVMPLVSPWAQGAALRGRF